MPIFEYECSKCKKIFEFLVANGGPKTVKCPFCSSRSVTKLLSSFSVGSGDSRGGDTAEASSTCMTCSSKDCSTCG